jgi:hypothetical protein
MVDITILCLYFLHFQLGLILQNYLTLNKKDHRTKEKRNIIR